MNKELFLDFVLTRAAQTDNFNAVYQFRVFYNRQNRFHAQSPENAEIA